MGIMAFPLTTASVVVRTAPAVSACHAFPFSSSAQCRGQIDLAGRNRKRPAARTKEIVAHRSQDGLDKSPCRQPRLATSISRRLASMLTSGS